MKGQLLVFLGLLFISFAGQTQRANTGSTQQVSLQAGQVFSELQFRDSFGSELQNVNPVNRFFMMAEYRSKIFPKQLNEKVFGTIGVGFNGYGSKGSDRALNNYFEWDLSYLGLLLGLDYEYYQIGSFTGFINFKVSSEWLMRGSQVINDQVYDLKGAEDFDTPLTVFRGGLGVKFQLTDETSIFLHYMIGKSYSFFDSGSSELNIIAQNFGVGLFTYMSYNANRRPRYR